MAESVYKVIELVGTSTQSWEKAAQAAVKMASRSLRDLRIAEVSELDMQLENGQVVAYRAKVKVSFKYDPDGARGGGAAETKKAEPPAAKGVKKAPRKKK